MVSKIVSNFAWRVPTQSLTKWGWKKTSLFSSLHVWCWNQNSYRQHFQIDSRITGATLAGMCLEFPVLAVLETTNHILYGRTLSVDQGRQTTQATDLPQTRSKTIIASSMPRPRRKPNWSPGCSFSKYGTRKFNNNPAEWHWRWRAAGVPKLHSSSGCSPKPAAELCHQHSDKPPPKPTLPGGQHSLTHAAQIAFANSLLFQDLGAAINREPCLPSILFDMTNAAPESSRLPP